MLKVRILNKIAKKGLECLPAARYEVGETLQNPDAIILRSFKMHDLDIPSSLRVVGRAGAGVNNIPVSKMTSLGIPVLNTPGANANAVKELVLAGMLLAARNICQAWQFVGQLNGADKELSEQVENSKKQFVGFELPGRVLGVIGLGAIGVKLANAALSLGMKVIGFDPAITVQRAWELSSGVIQAKSLQDLLYQSDFISCHVPLIEATKNLISAPQFGIMKEGAVLLNFAREGIVNNQALLEALSSKLHAYVCDFPAADIKNHPKVMALPHLGASTHEAEENCAMMVAQQVDDYLLNGNIVNSVNFPETVMPRAGGYRIAVVNANIPNMLGQISTVIAEANLNIRDMLNKSRDNIAYTLIDVEKAPDNRVLEAIAKIEGVVRVKYLA